ncbi:outer membrane lipid asymmetry maintenance protein MlaD [Inquilinus limosus]|uniref:outer membrane lipid asymmetry maintenance protein MlaD n=1 Tax=Inquilinus limosus TaxID=171674 RepID=UPI003F169E57
MHRNVIETVMGAVVLAVALVFLGFAYTSANLRTVPGYRLKAQFDQADGIAPGTDVRIGGVKVGTVTDVTLNPETYLADVELSIDPSIRLSQDTAAAISSDGLLGGRSLTLSPGARPDDPNGWLKDGDTIDHTQSNPSLEQLLGQVIFSIGQLGDRASGSGAGGAPDQAPQGKPGGMMGN